MEAAARLEGRLTAYNGGMSPTLVSIQVSLPKTFGREAAADPMDRPWTTGFFKEPVTGPVEVTWSNVVGDGQADLENHGGPDKAVLAYSADHYSGWLSELQLPRMPHGAFGENFTVANLTETGVCVGDVWRIGPCVFEVSQPRQPCWKLARRWRIKNLPAMVVTTGRSGWYFRIKLAGVVEAGMPVVLERRPNPDWTIDRANRVFYHMKNDTVAAAELLAVGELSMSWKESLHARIERSA